MSKLNGVILAFFIFCTAGMAQASTMLYDETVSGDLLPFSKTGFTLQEGANSVLGTLGLNRQGLADFDGFTFSAGNNLTLTDIDFFVTATDNSEGILKNAQYQISLKESHGASALASQSVSMTTPLQQSMFEAVLPASGPLSFAFSPGGFSWSGYEGPDFLSESWNYEVVLTTTAAGGSGPGTSPVPEPTTMLLFGTGIIGLIGAARRRGITK